MLWDIFCNVIDNHGDIGVCWRLAAELASRGEMVRLWVDDSSALSWMAPQGRPGVQVLPWTVEQVACEPGDVTVEAFGCQLSPAWQAAMAAAAVGRGRQPAWINLEYLTAESFAQRSHSLPSPVLSGPATGLTKYFFYPGFTVQTGGLLRERDLAARQWSFDRHAWLAGHGIDADGDRLVSLFCYEPAGLNDLLGQLVQGPGRTRLLVTAGRATRAVQAAGQAGAGAAWCASGSLSISFLPLLSQFEFDHLLWSCDLNFVRGEDSLVRALWAGKPLVWQIYPQDDNAHQSKLAAFLDWLDAPDSLRQFHLAWNSVTSGLPPLEPAAWSDCISLARDRLQTQDDLAARLLRFARALG